MDSNHDKQNQNLLCYRYTTGQKALTAASILIGRGEGRRQRQEPLPVRDAEDPDTSSTYLAVTPNLSTITPPCGESGSQS